MAPKFANPTIDVLSVSLSQDGGQWRREARKEFGVVEGLSGITDLGTLAGLIDVGEAGFGVNNPDSPRARREVLLRLEHKIVRVVPGRGNFDGEIRRAFQTLAGINSYEPISADEGDVGDAYGALHKLKVGLHSYFTELPGARKLPQAKANLVADTVMNQARRWGHGKQFSLVEFVIHAFLFRQRVVLLDGHQSSGGHGACPRTELYHVANIRNVANTRRVRVERKRATITSFRARVRATVKCKFRSLCESRP